MMKKSLAIISIISLTVTSCLTIQKSGSVAVDYNYSGMNSLNKLAYSPDGRFIATGGPGALYLRDATSGELVRDFKLNVLRNLNSLAFSPDGRSLATGGPGAFYLWNL